MTLTHTRLRTCQVSGGTAKAPHQQKPASSHSDLEKPDFSKTRHRHLFTPTCRLITGSSCDSCVAYLRHALPSSMSPARMSSNSFNDSSTGRLRQGLGLLSSLHAIVGWLAAEAGFSRALFQLQ